MRRWTAGVALIGAMLPGLAAGQTTSPTNTVAPTVGQQAFTRWKIQDNCIAEAVKAHPNRDLASQHERDLSVDKCLASHDLPPRAHMAPDPEKDQASPR